MCNGGWVPLCRVTKGSKWLLPVSCYHHIHALYSHLTMNVVGLQAVYVMTSLGHYNNSNPGSFLWEQIGLPYTCSLLNIIFSFIFILALRRMSRTFFFWLPVIVKVNYSECLILIHISL